MARDNFNDLLAFVHVVREGSFTRAAALLGVSPSALSHCVTDLEARLFVNVAPRFEAIDSHLAAVSDLCDKPVGTIRITSAEHAANTILWPKLTPILHQYPEINVEINVDYAMSDIVSQRYDAGVRLGNQVAKDMIAVRISPDLRIAVVATPSYFSRNPKPVAPNDLAQHNCINLRLPTHGGLLPWDFEKDGKEIKLRFGGQWVFNSSSAIVRAALDDYGIAFVPEDMVLEHIAAGRLVRVLDDWCAPYPGYYLYYPSRQQSSRAHAVVVDALRHRV
jgi:DNA-binding transcriptional LysR family regulator